MTSPPPDGNGASRCMQMALDDAGIRCDQVDYINAHGTSTELNDLYETRAIKAVFQGYAHKVAVSSSKSMTGHLLGGSGGIEAVFSAMAVYDDIMPPTINYEHPAEELTWSYVPNTARKHGKLCHVPTPSGSAGTNATLLFRNYKDSRRVQAYPAAGCGAVAPTPLEMKRWFLVERLSAAQSSRQHPASRRKYVINRKRWESTASRAGKAALRAVLFLSATGGIVRQLFSWRLHPPSLYYR